MDTLYSILQHAHSGLRWVVVILLAAAIVKAAAKRRGGTVYPGKDSLALFAFITTHIQLLIGLVLYFFLSPYVQFHDGMMSNSIERFYTMEHLLGMVIAIALITVGYIRAKKEKDLNKGWKTIFTFYLIGLILILLFIPWPFRGLGADWF